MQAPNWEDVKTTMKAMAEIHGKNLSAVAATMLVRDLVGFTPPQVLGALERCRRDLSKFPCTAEIIARVDDGRPGVEEAWAMIPKDESGSVVWTDEMSQAFGPARAILEEGDAVAARMAFKEVYGRLVADARAKARPVNWWPSLGHDRSGREEAVRAAVERGRLTAPEAEKLIGYTPIPKRNDGEGGLSALGAVLPTVMIEDKGGK